MGQRLISLMVLVGVFAAACGPALHEIVRLNENTFVAKAAYGNVSEGIRMSIARARLTCLERRMNTDIGDVAGSAAMNTSLAFAA